MEIALNAIIVANPVILLENATTTIEGLPSVSAVIKKDIWPKIVLRAIEKTICSAINAMKLVILPKTAIVEYFVRHSMILFPE